MSITDELREWEEQHKGWHLFDMQLTAIADRGAHDGRADGRPAGRGADVPAHGGRKGVARVSATDELREMLDEQMEFALSQTPEALQAENAKLREELESVGTAAYLYGRSDLKAENAKLRELVRDYIDAPCTTCDCWQDEFRCWNYDGADCGLVARARELGVEVDG